jgi:L-ribulokinase
MMPKYYSLGLDYGTESARAVLVDVANGREVSTVICNYPHGVMDEFLPGVKKRLPPDWALQHPGDYLKVLGKIAPQALAQAKIKPEQVIGVGVDFTACSIMPIDAAGNPLCLQKKWAKRPHSWLKLWKHHAAQPEADMINALAKKRKQSWLQRYGGLTSSEWMFAKLLQILDEDPTIYNAADKFIEAGDWLVMQLTGNERRSACLAGYKALWSADDGYPKPAFLRALNKDFANVVKDKLCTDVYPLGAKAGEITPEAAAITGLAAGTPVAVAVIDAHSAVPACTVTTPGKMVMIMGTSTCHMMVDKTETPVEGTCGVVKDGIIPGLYGYEGGQSGVGDIFAWYIDNGVPAAYYREARKQKISMHEHLTNLAKKLKPGETGLLALDWINGNRSVLVNADLTGMFVGMNMTTRPEEIYRALVEATAFGTLKIIQTFVDQGVPVRGLYACGGLAEKNPMLMQIYADVTGREIKIAASPQAVALGSAMFGAVVAGKKRGGYSNITAAARKMATLKKKTYKPDKKNHAIYQKLFAEYNKLHDYFGRGENQVMKNLKQIREEVQGG